MVSGTVWVHQRRSRVHSRPVESGDEHMSDEPRPTMSGDEPERDVRKQVEVCFASRSKNVFDIFFAQGHPKTRKYSGSQAGVVEEFIRPHVVPVVAG
jgi:hypothetical protein